MPSRSSSMATTLLQGPRPAPLKVNSTGTATTGTDNKRRRLNQHQAPPPPRQPVIIYVESPRVVHAHPGEFKSVVQRLTGAPAPPPPMMVFPGSSSAPPPPPLQLQFPFQFPLVGAAGSAGAMLPLTSSVMSSVTLADTTTGGGGSPVHHQQLANHDLLVSAYDQFLPSPPSLAACYQHHGGDIFVGHHH